MTGLAYLSTFIFTKKLLLDVFPTLISVSNAYLSVVHCRFAQCRAGLCEVKQLCVDRQAVLILFDALSLSWQCADWICLRQFGSVDRENAEVSGYICVPFPGRWCPLCTDAVLNAQVHHAHSCRKPCRCSPEWTVTFNNSSDLVRKVQNESRGKRGRLRSGARRYFLTKIAAKWNLVNRVVAIFVLFWRFKDFMKYLVHVCLIVLRSSNMPVYS